MSRLAVGELLSPNCDSREGCPVNLLVLHYTGMPSAKSAIDRMCDPQSKVSAHYVVDEDGSILRLVPEEKRAWHAGVSSWRGETKINHHSIGIEIVNPGHEFGYRVFPRIQMQSVIELARDVVTRNNIPARNVVAHSDIAPLRKEDPGELFEWEWLAKEGVGFWPKAGNSDQHHSPEAELALYGYDITNLTKAIVAFQRHFRPKNLNGQWDGECQALLESLLLLI